MRETLLNEVGLFGGRFVDKLMDIEKRILQKEREMENQIKQAKKTHDSLKEQIKENERQRNRHNKNLLDEIGKCKQKQAELDSVIREQNNLKGGVQLTLKKTQEVHNIILQERKLGSEELKKHKDKTLEYQKKIDLLGNDFRKNEQRSISLNDRDHKVEDKERFLHRKEQEIINKEHMLSERELDVRTKEKQIKLEYKRLKLDG